MCRRPAPFEAGHLGACKENGVELYATYRSDRENWIQGMVLAEMGFAFMPEYSVTANSMLGRPLIEPEVRRTVMIVSMRGRPYSPVGKAFVRAVHANTWSN